MQLNNYQHLYQNATYEDGKPVLRRLPDMTNEEIKDLGDMVVTSEKSFEIGYTPDQFLWLLSKNFDLYGLIEAGLALEEKLSL